MYEPVADPVPAPTVDLDAIRARADAATPGPWGYDRMPHEAVVLAPVDPDDDERVVAYTYGNERSDADATFIAHARTDVAGLAAELSVLRAREAQVREELRHHQQYRPAAWDAYDCCGQCNADTGGYVAWPCQVSVRLAAALDGTTGSGKTG